MVSYQTNTAGPDITITLTGGRGSGKSCLMGDIAGMLQLYGCEVRCYKRPRLGGLEQQIPTPGEGNFNQTRKVKIVEVN